MKLKTLITTLVALGSFGFAMQSHAWTPDPNNSEQTNAAETIAAFKAQDPSIQRFFDKAVGFAVFPSVGKGGIGIGGAHGKGLVFFNGEPIGRSSLS